MWNSVVNNCWKVKSWAITSFPPPTSWQPRCQRRLPVSHLLRLVNRGHYSVNTQPGCLSSQDVCDKRQEWKIISRDAKYQCELWKTFSLILSSAVTLSLLSASTVGTHIYKSYRTVASPGLHALTVIIKICSYEFLQSRCFNMHWLLCICTLKRKIHFPAFSWLPYRPRSP